MLKKSYWRNIFGYTQSDTNVLPNSNFSQVFKTHGSTVAHMIGAKDNNVQGVCGVAPNTDIVPIKCDMKPSSIAEGIKYAYQNGAKVINVSAGPSANGINLESVDVVRAEMYNAYLNGVTVIYGAGNEHEVINYDADYYTGALCIGAVNKNQEFMYVPPSGSTPSAGSGYGTRVDLAAAGQQVTSGSVDDNGNSYQTRTFNGTSLAIPIVAGAAALVRSFGVNVDEARDALVFTADIAYEYNRDLPNSFRAMSGDMNGSEGWAKMRVLNAGSAVRLVSSYNSAYPIQIYRPAADDYGQIKATNGSQSVVENWFDVNILANYPLNVGQIECHTYNVGSAWADSVTVFKYRRAFAYNIEGAPFIYAADAVPSDFGTSTHRIQNTWTSNGFTSTNQWVNPTFFNVY